MTGLLLFVLFIFAALAWWRLLQGKEAARAAAASACKEHGLLLMDDTVVLEGIELPHNSPSRSYGLSYRFDFAHEGILRKGGKVLVSPGQAIRVIISTSSGQVIEEID
jgi:hypothetical protein